MGLLLELGRLVGRRVGGKGQWLALGGVLLHHVDGAKVTKVAPLRLRLGLRLRVILAGGAAEAEGGGARATVEDADRIGRGEVDVLGSGGRRGRRHEDVGGGRSRCGAGAHVGSMLWGRGWNLVSGGYRWAARGGLERRLEHFAIRQDDLGIGIGACEGRTRGGYGWGIRERLRGVEG